MIGYFAILENIFLRCYFIVCKKMVIFKYKSAKVLIKNDSNLSNLQHIRSCSPNFIKID